MRVFPVVNIEKDSLVLVLKIKKDSIKVASLNYLHILAGVF